MFSSGFLPLTRTNKACKIRANTIVRSLQDWLKFSQIQNAVFAGRVINKDVSPEDVDLIFLIFADTNRGVLSKNEFYQIMQKLTSGIMR